MRTPGSIQSSPGTARPGWRRLFFAAGFATVGHLTGASYSVESLGFRTMNQASAAGTFSVEGTLARLANTESIGANYRLQGDLRTVGPAAPSSWLGINLLPFGNAEGLDASETPLSGLPGWEIDGALLVTQWGTAGGWPLTTDSGPPDRGLNFYAGGPDTGPGSGLTTATHRTTLPFPADAIDSGRLSLELSGWFGGFQGQADTAYLSVRLLDGTGRELEALQVGGVTPEMRAGRTGLLKDSTVRPLPPGARQLEVALTLQRSAPLGWNDGYADNLRLVIFEPPPASMELSTRLNVGGQLEFTFPSQVGRTYALEWLNAIEPAVWAVFPGSERAGTGSELRYELPVESSVTGRFYRLRME